MKTHIMLHNCLQKMMPFMKKMWKNIVQPASHTWQCSAV